MAKKKDNAAGGIIIVIFVAILITISLLTPIVIIGGYLISSIRASIIKRRLSGDICDFWLNRDEKKQYINYYNEFCKIDKIIRDAINRGNEKGISVNKDGSFSSRSNLGKEINSIISTNLPIHSRLSKKVDYYKFLPINRWQEFNNHVRSSKAFLWSSLFYILTIAYFYYKQKMASAVDILMAYLALATNWYREEAHDIPLSNENIEMIAVSTVVAILSFSLFRTVFRNSAQKFSPKPPAVIPETLDLNKYTD